MLTRSLDHAADALARLQGIASQDPDAAVLDALDAARRALAGASFRLVVIGEFKRGKSTLVNALLGKAVLPMGVTPITSIITEVTFGDAPGAIVEFDDGARRAIPLEDIEQFVTEVRNPGNVKRVRRVLLHDDAPFLRNGISIVDTPGVGSVFRHNSELTYGYLREADAVVMVLGADQPVTAGEDELLRALGDVSDRILFVVNRVDVLREDDIETAMRFVREQLATRGFSMPERVLPVSALVALGAKHDRAPLPPGFTAFEHALRRVLIDRKTEILMDRALGFALGAVEMISLRLAAQRRVADLSVAEIERALGAFQSALPAFRSRADEASALLHHAMKQLYDVTLRESLDAAAARVFDRLWPGVEESLSSVRARPTPGVVRTLAESVGARVIDELRAYFPETERIIGLRFSVIQREHAQRIHAVAADTVALANRLLGMQAAVPVATAALEPEARFFFRDRDYSGGISLENAWLLRLPRRWSVPAARRSLQQLLERRIRQNLGAIRYDWMTRLDDAVRRFDASSRGQLDQFTSVIEEALERGRQRREIVETERARALGMMEARSSELQGLRDELVSLRRAAGANST